MRYKKELRPAFMPTLAPRNLRQAPPRRRSLKAKIVAAMLGSLLLHAVLLLVLGWVVPHWPHAKVRVRPPPIHLTLAPSNPVATAPAGTPPSQYIRTLEEQKAQHAPVNAQLISDKDTNAAAELAATGDKPLPTQQGREIPTYDFETRPYRPGKNAEDAASAAPAAPPSPDQPSKTPDNKKPAPHTKVLHPPKAAPTPKSAGELAALPPDASPTPEPPTPTETPDEASAPPPRPSQVATTNPSVNSRGLQHLPGYQPQTIKSKVSGNISNRGIAAPEALGTPLGRYQKQVEDAIGMLWYQFIEDRMDVVSGGEVKLHFYVERSGKVDSLTVSSGKSNGTLADVSIQAVSEAPLPPIPADVAATLDGGRLELDFGFGVY